MRGIMWAKGQWHRSRVVGIFFWIGNKECLFSWRTEKAAKVSIFYEFFLSAFRKFWKWGFCMGSFGWPWLPFANQGLKLEVIWTLMIGWGGSMFSQHWLVPICNWLWWEHWLYWVGFCHFLREVRGGRWWG